MRTFGGIPEKYAQIETSEVILVQIPYEGTCTYGKGTSHGPKAILDAAENMELYDIETDSEVYKRGIYVSNPIKPLASPELMTVAIEKKITNFLCLNSFVTILGGEHSISIGCIKAFQKKFENLTVLQLDAHSDLRANYNGTAYNHACAMHEASKTSNLLQVGIRSMDNSELKYVQQQKLYTSYDILKFEYWKEDVINQLTENVYITIDVDVFDPSIMPSTGTPEPGGLFWYEVLDLLKGVFLSSNVVGFDIVELAPKEDLKAPDFMIAKLYYKLLSYKFEL